jgi:hypothetical protein
MHHTCVTRSRASISSLASPMPIVHWPSQKAATAVTAARSSVSRRSRYGPKACQQTGRGVVD